MIGTIRAALVSLVVQALDQRSGRADFLLHAEGLSRSGLEDGYNQVSLKRYLCFLDRAAAELHDPAFGFQIGTQIRPADLGPTGALFASAPTLGRALEDFCRWIAALKSNTMMNLHRRADLTIVSHRVVDTAIGPQVQDSEFMMAAICSLIRSSVNIPWHPLEIHFRHSRPHHQELMQDYFDAAVLFRMPTDSIVLRSGDLGLSLPYGQESIRISLERHISDLVQIPVEVSILRHVTAAVELQLPHGNPTLAKIAHDVGMSARTLQRTLAQEGTSLREILRLQRRRRAETMLEDGRKSHAQIAQALGYADATVFWRAFKGWTGRPPSGSIIL